MALPCCLAIPATDFPPRRHLRRWGSLRTGLDAKVHEGYLASRRTPWYSQEDRPPAPFLCTYMPRGREGGRPFRLIWNKSSATAHNVLMRYPKGELKAPMGPYPAVAAKVFAALKAIDTESFAGQGRVYGGVLFKMEPRELAATPAGFVVEATGVQISRQGSLFDGI